MSILPQHPRCFASDSHGCLTENYARTYLATQELIVPRRAYFSGLAQQIAEQLAQSPARQLTIVEPGVGTGDFLAVILETAAHENWSGHLRLVAADFSEPMIMIAQARLAPLVKNATTATLSCEIDWLAPLDLLHPESWAQLMAQVPHRADVVGCFQFEHYFPNHADSPLARRWAGVGVPVMSKTALRRTLGQLVAPGGFLYGLDDYLTPTAEPDEAQWDVSVVRALTDQTQLEHLRKNHADIAEKITRHYGPGRSAAELQHLARRARARRRHRCWEEVQSWTEAQADWTRLYGEKMRFFPQCLGPHWPAFAAWTMRA